MKHRVLISAPYFLSVIERYRPYLESNGVEIIVAPVRERLSEEELLLCIDGIDGVICGDDRFTKRVILSAPDLKVISKWGTGIDSIDLTAAAAAGIRVFNTVNAFTDPVADTTLGYILSFARNIPWLDRDVRAGNWIKTHGVGLRECTLGIVGLGNIGLAVAKRARACGMRVLATDPQVISESLITENEITMCDLQTLLGQSDFVTLHCDLNPGSFQLIGGPELERMRPSAYLINTARGHLINEPHLIEALQSKTIAGAALDVFAEEPLPSESPLRLLGNCLLAPHNSNSSPSAWERVHESTVANLLRGLRGEA